MRQRIALSIRASPPTIVSNYIVTTSFPSCQKGKHDVNAVLEVMSTTSPGSGSHPGVFGPARNL